MLFESQLNFFSITCVILEWSFYFISLRVQKTQVLEVIYLYNILVFDNCANKWVAYTK